MQEYEDESRIGSSDEDDRGSFGEGVEDMGDDQEYEMEAKAFERVGGAGVLAELLSSSGGLIEGLQDNKKKMREISAEDRFLIFTDAFCRKLTSEGIVTVTERDITNILRSSQKLPHIRYKNYVAYVLGYLASQGGRDLSAKNVRDVLNLLPKIKEGGVTPPDIIRYARFWTKFL